MSRFRSHILPPSLGPEISRNKPDANRGSFVSSSARAKTLPGSSRPSSSAGHFVGGHTHSHLLLNDFSSNEFISDINSADELLKPWLGRAPQKLFRHPLNLWGNTEAGIRDGPHQNARLYAS
jgi:peptidoglycan/xylan/chitin deacetylase (PgdA/CDA1 family)